MSASVKYTKKTVKDYEWVEMRRGGHSVGCCDCALTHTVRFRIRGRKLFLMFVRDHKLTRIYRRQMRTGVKNEVA